MPEASTAAAALVVDDSAMMLRIMSGIVSELGFAEVDTCQSGQTALAQLEVRNYAFILCDQEMDQMTGAEFARRARKHPYNAHCPIIIATASRESAAQCVHDGVLEFVDSFIFKPFRSAELQNKLSEIEVRRRTRRALLSREPLIARQSEGVAE